MSDISLDGILAATVAIGSPFLGAALALGVGIIGLILRAFVNTLRHERGEPARMSVRSVGLAAAATPVPLLLLGGSLFILLKLARAGFAFAPDKPALDDIALVGAPVASFAGLLLGAGLIGRGLRR